MKINSPCGVVLMAMVSLVAGQDTTDGESNCECRTEFPQEFLDNSTFWRAGGTLVFIKPDGNPQALPTDYGLGCTTWDSAIPTLCADEDGNAFTGNDRKSWCDESFCFVDETTCDVDHYPSGFFEGSGLYYSYATCGSENHFAKSYKALQMDAATLIAEIIATVEKIDEAVTSTYGHLMANDPQVMRDYVCTNDDYEHQRTCGCEADEVCQPASADSGWTSCTEEEKSNGQCTDEKIVSLSYTTNALYYADDEDPSSAYHDPEDQYYDTTGDPDGLYQLSDYGNYSMTQCIASSLKTASLRAVHKLYSDPSNVAYIYTGTQYDGTLHQWPALDECNDGTYDPRFRPWYASTVSGPKNVVAVLDRSGSMGMNDRWTKTIEAVDKVLKTLTENDRFHVVLFNREAEVPTEPDISSEYWTDMLNPASADFKAALNAAVGSTRATGGTNFAAGLEAAYRLLDKTHINEGNAGQNCQDLILFMTDGEDQYGFDMGDFDDIQCKYESRPTIFTYGFGDMNSIDVDSLVLLAKHTDGIFYEIGDDANLGDKMSQYYNYFVQAIPTTQLQLGIDPTFIRYSDSFTGVELFAACKPSFYTDNGHKDFIGVSCVDVNLMIHLNDLATKTGSDDFKREQELAAMKCHGHTPSAAILEELRKDAWSGSYDSYNAGSMSCTAGSDSGSGAAGFTAAAAIGVALFAVFLS